ncbi:MAG: HNH endonuclease [Pseudomonadota bacterium]|nr:HNH endonuclease [Pseudomonadota bacterium]
MLVARYPHEKTENLVEVLDRPVKLIHSKAKNIGLKKTQEYLNSPDACRLRRGDNVGVATRFNKGHVPANKGTKRPGYSIGHGRMAETTFKNGQMPHNTCEVGSYRFDKDNVLQRKIGNAKGSNSKRWRGVHELVWVESNGPIPPGHICVFKPGMKTNVLEEITIDRVECITRAELMLRNSVQNLPEPLRQVIQLNGALKRKIHGK